MLIEKSGLNAILHMVPEWLFQKRCLFLARTAFISFRDGLSCKQRMNVLIFSSYSVGLEGKVLGGYIKNRKLPVAKQGSWQSGDHNVWKEWRRSGHLKTLDTLRKKHH